MLALLRTIHIMFPQILNAYWQLALVFVPKTCQKKRCGKGSKLGLLIVLFAVFSVVSVTSEGGKFSTTLSWPQLLSHQLLVTNHVNTPGGISVHMGRSKFVLWPCTLKYGECMIVFRFWGPYMPHVEYFLCSPLSDDQLETS